MNINKIIEKILSNSIVNTKGDIDVNDNSYLWDIIQNPKESTSKKFSYGTKFSVGDSIKERYNSSIKNNQKYPITCFIYRVIVYLFKLMIWCFYRVASFIRQLFISDKDNKDRATDVSTSPRFNFIVFIATIVTYIVLIVIILSFFIKSVLLFRPDTRINESGAINMPQSCERENYMYLLNSATYWGNSGIKVLKGDEVSITVSGSFFSKIGEMYNSALNNKKPKYERTFVSFDRNKNQQSDTSEDNKLIEFYRKFVTLYKKTEKPSDTSEHNKLLVANLKYPNRHVNDMFGSLLIQIRDNSEHTPFHLGDIISDTASTSTTVAFHFEAEKSGYLHFAVNDEYITESWFEDSIKPNTEIQSNLDISNIAKLPEKDFKYLVSLIKEDNTNKTNNKKGIEDKDLDSILRIDNNCIDRTLTGYKLFTFKKVNVRNNIVKDLDRLKVAQWLKDMLDIQNFAKVAVDRFTILDSIYIKEHDYSFKSNQELYPNYVQDTKLQIIKEVYLTKACYNLIKNNQKYQDAIGWTSDTIKQLTVWDKWNERIATMWYSDNVGDILINVRVKRKTVHGNILEPTLLSKAYREMEDFFLLPPFGLRKILTIIGILFLILGWMALDNKYGRGILKGISSLLCNRVKRILSYKIDS